MDKTIIIKIAICLAYYHLGGMATTNMLRLCRGNTLSVLKSDCRCPECNAGIPWYLQLPVISFIVCKGKCKSCGSPIPKDALLLEITVITVMSVVSWLFRFSVRGVLVSFAVYEIIKIICVFIYGKREEHFIREYFLSVTQNIVPFILVEFMAILLASIS